MLALVAGKLNKKEHFTNTQTRGSGWEGAGLLIKKIETEILENDFTPADLEWSPGIWMNEIRYSHMVIF